VILTPGYPFTPIAFLALIVVMLVLLTVHSPREAILGSLVVIAGWPMYDWIIRRKSRARL
jgi:hypothetical protein